MDSNWRALSTSIGAKPSAAPAAPAPHGRVIKDVKGNEAFILAPFPREERNRGRYDATLTKFLALDCEMVGDTLRVPAARACLSFSLRRRSRGS